MVAGGMKVLFVDDAHDIVDVLMVYGQAGIAVFRKDFGDLVHGVGILHGHDIHPGGEDLLHLQVAELDGGADQRALILVQAALVFGLRDHGDKLLFRDSGIPLLPDNQTEELLPLGGQEGEGTQQGHEQPQKGGGEHGELLGKLLGHAFGGDLAEDKDHDGDHEGGDGRPLGLTQQRDEQQCGKRGGRIVDHVVADEDGGQQPVIIIGQGQGGGSPPVPGLRPALQTNAVERGKGGLCGGKIGGKDDQDKNGDELGNTGRVHEDRSTPFFRLRFCVQKDSPMPRCG